MGEGGIKFQQGGGAKKSHLKRLGRAAGRAGWAGMGRGGDARRRPASPARGAVALGGRAGWGAAAAARAGPSAAAPGTRTSASPAGPSRRGARRDREVPGASAEMPGSDTPLTVDRTYSDPVRHQRCKRRVSSAGSAAVGVAPRGEVGWASPPV